LTDRNKATPRRQISILPLKIPRTQLGVPLEDIVFKAFRRYRLTPLTGDVVAVASKVASIVERRTVRLEGIRPSQKAQGIARAWNINPRLTQVILNESDEILGGVPRFLLTVKSGVLTPNAGIDQKNSPRGTITLWPRNSDSTADKLRKAVLNKFKARVGVVIVDSRITPLRMGTVGLAIGISGFSPIADVRRRRDLYGRQVKATRFNLADDIASAAHLAMGEVNERIGVVLVRGMKIQLGEYASRLARLRRQQCLITANLKPL
jgi:coenzyme F420-0:L-glutamate ligase